MSYIVKTPPSSPSSSLHLSQNPPLKSLDEIAEHNTLVLSDEISQMTALVQVIYDHYGNSIYLNMAPGMTLSNLELKNLVALRLQMISDINKDSEKVKQGIFI